MLRTRLLVILLAALASSGGAAFAADGAIVTSPGPAPSDALEPVEPVEPQRRGPFNVRRFALRDLSIDELSWTGERPPPLPPLRTTDEAGVPMFRWVDGGLYYRPGALAINGMKRIDAYRETGDRRHLTQALLQAAKLRDLAIRERGAAWLPFWFDYRPARLEAPWFNAMSQGLALSFFVRLHAVTRDPAHSAIADELFRSFSVLGPREDAWVSLTDRNGYLWLEHYPNGRRDHHLNAHLHAVFGLYEYWQVTRSPVARLLLEGAITTIRDRAGRFRRPGRPSFYSSRTKTVIVGYHEIHVWQLRLLGEVTGDPYFTRLGDDLAIDHPPRAYVPGRPADDGIRAVRPEAPLVDRLGTFPPTGAWSHAHA